MWTAHNRWLLWDGRKDAAVFLVEQCDGRFLWTFRKWAAYAASVDAAKEWIEALAESEAIPASQRWVNISNVFE